MNHLPGLLLIALVACQGDAIDVIDGLPPEPGGAFDVAPPPGTYGLSLTGPAIVMSGEVITFTVTAADLNPGDHVEFGDGTIEGDGFCPYRAQTGGFPCLNVKGNVRALGSAVAATEPGGVFAHLTLRYTHSLEHAFVQAFLLRGQQSATSRTHPIQVDQPWPELNPRVEDLEGTVADQGASLSSAQGDISGLLGRVTLIEAEDDTQNGRLDGHDDLLFNNGVTDADQETRLDANDLTDADQDTRIDANATQIASWRTLLASRNLSLRPEAAGANGDREIAMTRLTDGGTASIRVENFGSDAATSYGAGFKFLTTNYNGVTIATSERMVLQANGRLGVGTSAPKSPLHVAGAIQPGNDTGSCDTQRAGAVRFASSRLEACNGSTWVSLDAFARSNVGRTKPTAATTCKAIRDAEPAAEDGWYWVYAGTTAANAYQAYCDMTGDGGGWTRVVQDASYTGVNSTNQYQALAGGTYGEIRATWNRGYVSCSTASTYPTLAGSSPWQACRGSHGDVWSFELQRDGADFLVASVWHNLPTGCVAPTSVTAPMLCTVSISLTRESTLLTPTWHENRTNTSTSDNHGTIWVDLWVR